MPSRLRLASQLGLAFVLGSTLVAPACSPDVEETSSGDDTSSSATAGAGGTPSVASSSTTVGGGGSGAATGIQCAGSYTDVPPDQCDLLLQDCGAGLGCEPDPANGFKMTCVADTGVKGPGDACVNNESCRAGLHCVFNRCSPICCPTSGEPCGVNGVCNVNIVFGSFGAQVCSYLATCTLFTGECGDSANCYPLLDDGNSVCAPLVGPTVGEGELCAAINECNDSMVCNGGTCMWACFLDGQGLAPGAGGCPAGLTCTQGGMNPPQNIGVCI